MATISTPRAARRLIEFEHRQLVAQIEPGRWLIEEQNAGAVLLQTPFELHQHAGEMRALLFAARQRRDRTIGKPAQIGFVERGVNQPLDCRAASVAAPHADDLGNAEREGNVDTL